MILREKFSPTCFLAALGAGGLSVSFFMYLMFLVPHPKTPMATFDSVYPALLKGDWLSFVVAIALVFILVFAFFHFKLLIFNTKQFLLFKKSGKFKELIGTNAEISLMALPLTYTMTINVFFVLGAVFVPSLWDIVEYLFPFALIGFIVTGFFALKIFFNLLRIIFSDNPVPYSDSLRLYGGTTEGFACTGKFCPKDKKGNTLSYYLLNNFKAENPKRFENKLKLLQANGLQFNANQQDNNTLLHIAVQRNNLALLKRLSSFAIDVNAKNDEGFTALQLAAMQSKDTQIIKHLLYMGADKSVTTDFDESVYDLAVENELLQKSKASLLFLK